MDGTPSAGPQSEAGELTLARTVRSAAPMRTDLPEATGRARELARLLDSVFRVPGTRFRFGLDPLLGLVPGLGDAVGGAFGFYLLVLAFRAGAPPAVIGRMFLNIGADVIVGAVPFLGDLLDAGYKANIRNLGLLERYITRPEDTKKRSLALLIVLMVVLLFVVVAAVWIAANAIEAVLNALV